MQLSLQIEELKKRKFDSKIDFYGRTFEELTGNEINLLIQKQEDNYIAEWAYFLKYGAIEEFKELALLERQSIDKGYF